VNKHVFLAKDLLGHKRGARSAAFKTAMLSAMGYLAVQSRKPLIRDTLTSDLCGWIAFYPSETFILRAPRICVRFLGQHHLGDPARAVIDVDYKSAQNHRDAMSVEVIFPERLLGLEGLLGVEESLRYNGLYFNLTAGEYRGNLYEAINSVCDAFEIAESRSVRVTASV